MRQGGETRNLFAKKSPQSALGEKVIWRESVEQNNSLRSGDLRCKDIAKRV
jgi:hypothetical protein